MSSRPQRVSYVLIFCSYAICTLSAQTFRTIASFNGSDGSNSDYALVQGLDGKLYGTSEAGTNDLGVIFAVAPDASLSAVYAFCSLSNCPDGEGPRGALALAADGSFYGVTSNGGAYGVGTVFAIDLAGTLSTIYSFCPESCPSELPTNGLVWAGNGNLYGTTNSDAGTAYTVTTGGVETEIHRFEFDEGWNPVGPLVLGADGDFYGVGSDGGLIAKCETNEGCGAIFKMAAHGLVTPLYHFCSLAHCVDGAFPTSGLVQGSDGNFYGTTAIGGSGQYGSLFKENGGTVFKVTPGGTLTTLYSFCSQPNCTDGAFPEAGVIQASDGNFYGTTTEGGAQNSGTVFKIAPSGALTTIHYFCEQTGCPDGYYPNAGLVQATGGSLYGTVFGGANSQGTVFALTGLPPFVDPVPSRGAVGTTILILGTGLTGVTGVTFNGTAAAFSVVSGSAIGAVVPAGAATGPLQVKMGSGTLTSIGSFIVEP